MSSSPSQNSPEPRGLLHTLSAVFSFVLFGMFLSKLKAPQQQSINSIDPESSPEKAQEGSHKFIPFPSEIPPTPTNSENSCKCCHHKTPWWKILLDIVIALSTLGAFVAAGFYAGITHKMWKEMIRQSDIQKTGQRPWVGTASGMQISEWKFTKYDPTGIGRTFVIKGAVSIKNFGKTPAFGVQTSIEPFIARNTTERPNAKYFTCFNRDTQNGIGETVFPGNPLTVGINGDQLGFTVKDQPQVNRVWLVGCISYLDPDKVLHHTRFWLRSTHRDNAVLIDGGDGFSYMPIDGFESWGEETD